jgi:polar amino acid transport system ATP-binding protein
MDPAVVVFDEPTSALDPVMTREVAEVINQLHKDAITMICVTHDLQLASQISDKVVFLDKGVIVAEESIHAFSAHHSDEKVRNFFGSGV